jgi:hypothetical protein
MIGTRTLLGLLVAAIVSVGLAVWAWQSTHARLNVPGAGEPLLPDLAARGKDAVVIDIVMDDGEERIRLVRKGDAWFAGEAEYPADTAKIRKFLVELVKLRKAEPKTRLPRHYRILEVEDPGSSKQARGLRVTIRDVNDRVIADVILGKPAYDRLGAGRKAQYARLVGERQSWLVEGLVRPLPALTRWVDHYAVDLPRESIVRGRIVHADGEVLEVRATGKKGADGEPVFEIVGLPAGVKTKPNYQIAAVARDMAQLDFELARRARPHKEKPLVYAEVETRDGLVLGHDVWQEGNALWVRVRVVREGRDKKLAEAIRRETEGWEYGLSEARGSYFLKRLRDLAEIEEQNAEDLPEKRDAPAAADSGKGQGPAENGNDAAAGGAADGLAGGGAGQGRNEAPARMPAGEDTAR